MKFLFSLLCASLLAAAPAARGADRPEGMLNYQDAMQIYRQITELMEATSAAAPELARAGAPVIENARQARQLLGEGRTREHSAEIYKLLANARLYLQISDAVPKPKPFAEDMRRQLGELREKTDHLEAHFRATLEFREDQVTGGDWENRARYAEENRRLGPPTQNEQRVVFLGDSITDAWQLNQYFPGKPYINRGIGGQITGQMLERMKTDVLDLDPEAMVVLAGTNDIARGVPKEAIQDHLSMIGDLAEAHGIKAIFAAILPVGDYHKDKDANNERTKYRPPATILELNRWLRQYCQSRGFLYLDYHTPMADANGQLPAALAEDGLHPNREGYKLMARLAQAAIDQALRAPASQKKKKKFGIF